MDKLTNILSAWSLTKTNQIDPTFCEAYQYFTICNIAKNVYLLIKVATSFYFIGTTKSYSFYVWAALIFGISLLQIIYFMKLVLKLVQKSNRSQIATFLGFQQRRTEEFESDEIFVINNGSIYSFEEGSSEQGHVKWLISQIQNCIDNIDKSLCQLKHIQFTLDQIMQIYGFGLLILLELTDKWDKVYLICILYIGTYEYMEDYLIFSFRVAECTCRFIIKASQNIQHKWKFYRFNISLSPIIYSKSLQGFHQCRICLSAYSEEDQILILKCSSLHHFHAACIRQWMTNSITCPICRAQLFDL